MHEQDESGTTVYRPSDRRPLKSREWQWSQSMAAAIARLGVSPNTISVAGMLFAIAGGLVLVFIPATSSEVTARLGWVFVAVMCQLRLLANLFDGMVAIATDQASPTGELYNEIPDRVSDAALLIGAGYTVGGNPWLGYLAALAAITTAYIRAVGKSATGLNDYCGPMAKPQRMAVLTLVCLVLALSPRTLWNFRSDAILSGPMSAALAIVAVGAFYTCIRRSFRISRRLRSTDRG